ncbi:flavodoxin family protein [Brevundimonas sp. M20]|uniref:flavodoxin family protein n=1 Tax=Brevundimonas sp. M20 TaxID=2591463 RepID=UPI0011479930|nr:flavodoxin family protein [Brevundimonas sp. M20]QDH73738.1 flavodoxin family protein [Brevundimonas sp. M20]
MAKSKATGAAPDPRKGMPSPKLTEADFTERYLSQFRDPAFAPMQEALDKVASIAWEAYCDGRKSPVTRKAGKGYADPDYDLSEDWINARAMIDEAQARFEDEKGPLRVLLVNGSSRSEHTCPGEMSKSFRLVSSAQQVLEKAGVETKVLDLSRLASEYGRDIHPCKACFSTAAALCHWPCSCYPNYSLGQVHDWMNDIYPMWVEAHGVFIVTPVNWYQVSSPMKLMMDRLVCADGGNPDPTLTQGKDAGLAKTEELKGWAYPRHLQGRVFSVVVHGDVEGAENVRRSVSDWLKFMKFTPAGPDAEIDRYIGYWEPYATSHEALDRDTDMRAEVRIAAEQLARALKARRGGKLVTTYEGLESPRQK